MTMTEKQSDLKCQDLILFAFISFVFSNKCQKGILTVKACCLPMYFKQYFFSEMKKKKKNKKKIKKRKKNLAKRRILE